MNMKQMLQCMTAELIHDVYYRMDTRHHHQCVYKRTIMPREHAHGAIRAISFSAKEANT
jgi:hypothetical protein